MDKSIILLIAAGVALTFLHMPTVMMTLGTIITLAMVAIKICWLVVQSFAHPSDQLVMQRRTAPVRNY